MHQYLGLIHVLKRCFLPDFYGDVSSCWGEGKSLLAPTANVAPQNDPGRLKTQKILTSCRQGVGSR